MIVSFKEVEILIKDWSKSAEYFCHYGDRVGCAMRYDTVSDSTTTEIKYQMLDVGYLAYKYITNSQRESDEEFIKNIIKEDIERKTIIDIVDVNHPHYNKKRIIVAYIHVKDFYDLIHGYTRNGIISNILKND